MDDYGAGPLDMAALYLQMERPREALAALRDADPVDHRSYLLRGTAFLQLDRSGDAAQEFERGLEHEPESVPLLLSLAQAQMSVDAFAAEVPLRKALAREPQNTQIFATYVLILIEQSRYEWAETMLERGMAIDPDAMQHVRTIFLLRASNSSDALGAAQELLRSQPDEAMAHYLHGLALLSTLRPTEGVRHIREAAALRPADPMFASAARTLGAWYLWPVYLTGPPVHYILSGVVFIAAFVAMLLVEEFSAFWIVLGPWLAFTAYKWAAVGISSLLMRRRVLAAMRD